MMWPGGARVAVSLTYDGALIEHLEIVGPALAHYGMKGTFFVNPPKVLENVTGWENLAEEGHEIGNGCLLNLSDEGRLPGWNLRMVEQDLHMTQQFLRDMFPNSEPRTFAFPGKRTLCSQGSYRSVVADQFSYARSAHIGDNAMDCDLLGVRQRDMCRLSNPAIDQVRRSLLESVEDEEGSPIWYVLKFGAMFVGDDNRELLTHELALGSLASVHDRIWLAPISEVADHLARRVGATSAR